MPSGRPDHEGGDRGRGAGLAKWYDEVPRRVGKTTLLAMLLGLVRPDEGTLWLFGQTRKEYGPACARHPAGLSRPGGCTPTSRHDGTSAARRHGQARLSSTGGGDHGCPRASRPGRVERLEGTRLLGRHAATPRPRRGPVARAMVTHLWRQCTPGQHQACIHMAHRCPVGPRNASAPDTLASLDQPVTSHLAVRARRRTPSRGRKTSKTSVRTPATVPLVADQSLWLLISRTGVARSWRRRARRAARTRPSGLGGWGWCGRGSPASW